MIFLISVLAIICINWCIGSSRFRHWLLLTTGVIGVTVHECSHYLMAKVFGFKITQVRYFQMPTKANPQMGYVAFTRPKGVFGSIGHVFVSLAPLLLGALCLYLGSQLPYIQSLTYQLSNQPLTDFPVTLYSHITRASLGELFGLFSLASVTLYMLPSITDIKGALEGSLYLGAFFYIALSLGVVYLSQFEQILGYWLNALGTLMSIGVVISLPIALFAILTKR